MDTSRPRRIKDLFERALDLPPADRDQFLRAECEGDPELHASVQSLLEAHGEATDFLTGGSVERELAEINRPDSDPLLGSTVGDYRVLGLLGRGGMGAVYRAEQESPRREVALKLIDRNIVTKGVRQRFELEAQLLARLKHPGIAQIYVTGTTGKELGDQPYIAMELVEGQSLTSYADDHGLDMRARLELVIRVCSAVQHAHQLGVIHRDLKPANILVTDEGQPKILDFGVARSTDEDLQLTVADQGPGALLGTLPYMSPEQVRGNPDELDTRSDVHALGVLSYELLTGRLPRETEQKTVTEAIRVISHEEPNTLEQAGQGRFPADLETIVAKALAGERDRRYDSASELALDLRRFLGGHPITARPPSAVYQLRKLVSRNRLAAALFAGLVLVSIGSAVGMGFLMQRITGERDRATVQRQTADETSVFLQSLFLDIDPEQMLGREMTARDLLERGVERMKTELHEQPVVRGRLLAILGKVHESLGQPEQAEALLREAVEIGRALRAEHGEPVDRSNLEVSLQFLARCRGAAGQREQAIALAREAVALSAEVHGTESEHYATSLNHLGFHLSCVPEHRVEAREVVLEGKALRERLLGAEHVDVAWSIYQYAWLLHGEGDYAGAALNFERALAIWEKGLSEVHPQIARCLDEYSGTLARLERFDEALAASKRAFGIRECTFGEDHPAFADAHNNLGFIHWRMRDLPAARRAFAAAAEAHEAALGSADDKLLERLYTVAIVDRASKDSESEEAVLRRVLALAREHHADSSDLLSIATGKLGFFLHYCGRLDEAEPLLQETLVLTEAVAEPRFARSYAILEALAFILNARDDVPAALEALQRALINREASSSPSEPTAHVLRFRIGRCLLRAKRFDEAEPHLRELLEELEAAPDAAAYLSSNVRWCLANACQARGKGEEAGSLRDAVLAVDPDSLEAARCWPLLRRAEAHAVAGRTDEALADLRASVEAGLNLVDGRIALEVNPALDDELRRTMLAELQR